MIQGIGQEIAKGIIFMVCLAFVAGGLLVAALVFGIPWLWGLLKPWLHTITA